MKIKKNDTVVVITGKNKGKKGKVLRSMPKTQHIIVEKVNIVTKHIRKRQTQAGEIIKFEAPLPASNVMVVCPHCDKVTRVSYRKAGDGRKERFCKKCNGVLDQAVSTK